jgi:hypothetical protein
MPNTTAVFPTTVSASPLARRVDNPICPRCSKPMWVVRIERLGLGFDMRTLECRECKREATVVVKHA